MFLGSNFLILQFSYITGNVTKNGVSSVLECTSSKCYALSLNSEKNAFAGMAFALVTVLNIHKANGFSCPACSPSLQRLDLQCTKWYACRADSTNVLLLISTSGILTTLASMVATSQPMQKDWQTFSATSFKTLCLSKK